MKTTLEVLLTASILAAMYAAIPGQKLPTSAAVVPTPSADMVTIADGSDPLPGCRRCK
jgi:hypothetical protein